MTSTTLTIDQLEVSRLNVRTHRPDIEDTATLEASILEKGLIDAIQVHAMKGTKKFGAIDGQRRSVAIRKLIKRGDLPADWPIPVKDHTGKSDAELLELSITANLERRDLHAYELCAAVARCAANGHSVAEIARGIAEPEHDKVERWLRLGRLARPVFDAFSAGRLTLDQAKAYAATDDQELQATTFARLAAGADHYHTPAQIRAAMKFGDAEVGRLLEFVGFDAYRAAGGRFTHDLFSEEPEHRGRVEDEGKLQELVEAKLATIRDEVRVATQQRDLRFIVAPPKNGYDYTDYTLQVTPGGNKGRVDLPDGDVVAHIEIAHAGAHRVTYWWASRKAKFGDGAKGASGPVSTGPIDRTRIGDAIGDQYRVGARAEADAALKEDAGLSQDAIEIMRESRRAILRAALVQDADQSSGFRGGDVARDYFVWSQLRILAGAASAHQLGIQRLATETIGRIELAQKAKAHLDASGVRDPMERALAELTQQTFFTGKDLADAFLDFRCSGDRLKNLAAAVVCAFALDRSLAAPGYERPIHDIVAAETGQATPAQIRANGWRPTAELLNLMPKTQRIALVDNIVDAATRERWRALKNDEVTERVLAVVAGRPDWVHPLLTFDLGAPESTDADAEQLEAVA